MGCAAVFAARIGQDGHRTIEDTLTHLPTLAAKVLPASDQRSVVSRKRLHWGRSSAKGNNKIKGLSPFKEWKRKKGPFGARDCFAIVFTKTRAY